MPVYESDIYRIFGNDDWIERDHIPSLVDACLVEIKEYVETDGIERFNSLERMFRIKKFDVATSEKAIEKAIELGILDDDRLMYGDRYEK